MKRFMVSAIVVAASAWLASAQQSKPILKGEIATGRFVVSQKASAKETVSLPGSPNAGWTQTKTEQTTVITMDKAGADGQVVHIETTKLRVTMVTSDAPGQETVAFDSEKPGQPGIGPFSGLGKLIGQKFDVVLSKDGLIPKITHVGAKDEPDYVLESYKAAFHPLLQPIILSRSDKNLAKGDSWDMKRFEPIFPLLELEMQRKMTIKETGADGIVIEFTCQNTGDKPKVTADSALARSLGSVTIDRTEKGKTVVDPASGMPKRFDMTATNKTKGSGGTETLGESTVEMTVEPMNGKTPASQAGSR